MQNGGKLALYLPRYMPVLLLFLPLWYSKFLSGIICLFSEELSLAILLDQACSLKIFLIFPNWRMSLFNLYSWMIFLLVIEVWIDSYFLSVLKTMWHFFGLHGFWWRNVEPFNHSSLIGNLLFSFGLLFSLVFSSLIMICLGVDFLKFILFEIYWASWTSFSPNLESV